LTCSTLVSRSLMNRISRPRSIRAPSSKRARLESVAPAAAGLLVVGLEARRQRPVRDRPDVCLVDAHPNAFVATNDLGATVHERLLRVAASVGAHPAW